MANMFPKWYEVNGVKCQGKLELAVATALFEENVPFARPRKVETPHGSYSPDFETSGIFIEVKGMNTWLKACGVVPFMDNAKNEQLSLVSDNSLKKMSWTHNNVKRIVVFVDTTFDKKWKNIDVPPHDLTVVYGTTSDFINFMKESIWSAN